MKKVKIITLVLSIALSLAGVAAAIASLVHKKEQLSQCTIYEIQE